MPTADYPNARAATSSGGVTDGELVAAPASGWKVRVHQVYVSSDFLVQVIFESGTTKERWSQYCPSNGGSVVPASGSAWFECDDGEALTYSHSTGGACAVSVNYEIVRV